MFPHYTPQWCSVCFCLLCLKISRRQMSISAHASIRKQKYRDMIGNKYTAFTGLTGTKQVIMQVFHWFLKWSYSEDTEHCSVLNQHKFSCNKFCDIYWTPNNGEQLSHEIYVLLSVFDKTHRTYVFDIIPIYCSSMDYIHCFYIMECQSIEL